MHHTGIKQELNILFTITLIYVGMYSPGIQMFNDLAEFEIHFENNV